MNDLVKDFKAFITRGNVIDLAVAVVIGAAFLSVVNSLVNDVVLQIVAAIGGQRDFSSLTIELGDGRIYYGSFLTALINFVVIAAVVFLLVRLVVRLQNLRGSTGVEEAVNEEVQLLTQIRDELRARP